MPLRKVRRGQVGDHPSVFLEGIGDFRHVSKAVAKDGALLLAVNGVRSVEACPTVQLFLL